MLRSTLVQTGLFICASQTFLVYIIKQLHVFKEKPLTKVTCIFITVNFPKGQCDGLWIEQAIIYSLHYAVSLISKLDGWLDDKTL